MKYKIFKDGNTYVSNELSELVSTYIVSKDVVKQIFDDDYESVVTPIGECPMSMIMDGLLSEKEFNDFRNVYGKEIADYLEEDDNEWLYETDYCDAISNFDGWKIFRLHTTDEEKKAFDEIYLNDSMRITHVVNRMEGEW